MGSFVGFVMGGAVIGLFLGGAATGAITLAPFYGLLHGRSCGLHRHHLSNAIYFLPVNVDHE
jgi:transcriptional regulator GlxA family with amidase domain